MRFRGFAEELLGSRVKAKLLVHLLSEEALTSEREIAKLLGVSHTAVSKAVKDFHDLNLVTPLRIGNVLTWQLNKKSYAYKFLSNIISESKRSPLQDLKTTITSKLSHRDKVRKVIIFGSIAEGRELPNSDIDLFILVDDEKERKELTSWISGLDNECILSYGNKISPNILTWKEYLEKKNKRFLENVGKGIVVISK